MKKKALFVMNTMGNAGAERALLTLFDALLETERYELSLLVLAGQGELIGEVPKEVTILNEMVFHKKVLPESVLSPKGRMHLAKTVLKTFIFRGNIWEQLPYLWHNFKRMRREHRVQMDRLLWKCIADGRPPIEEEYDLAVAYLEGGATYYVANHVRAKKKVAYVHVDYEMAGGNVMLDGGCYDAYDRILAVSEEVKSAFLRLYPKYQTKIYVMENVLDCSKMYEKAKESGGFEKEDYGGKRILTVGRLTHQKAYEISIDAMALLKKRGIPVRWYVLGEGDQRKMLERKIRSLGLEEEFLLLGAVENPFPYYLQTDLYVHASRYEGKSIAIQEAQAMGCAVIASDQSGNREQIRHGEDGILCPLTPEGIANAVEYLLCQETLYQQCQKAAKKKMSRYANNIHPLEAVFDID